MSEERGIAVSSQTYHFGFGVDANYVKYAGVLMTNIVQLHPDRQLCFHLACDGIEDSDKHKLETFRQMHGNVKVIVYELQARLDDLRAIRPGTPERLNRSVLLRILLPSLVEQEAGRLVYMDVDVLCLRRLDELFELELGGMPVGAVPDTKSAQNAARLGLKSGKYCFAGMLVLDLPVWQRQKLTQRVVEYYQKYSNELLLLEQDALNAVLDGDFLELDKRFNYLIEVNNPMMAKYPEDAALLHCVNESKAWTKGCLPKIHDLYWQYVRQSPWHDLQPVEPTTVKAAFLAATSAELRGDYAEARKYYVVTINSFTEHYKDKAPQLLVAVKRDCLAAATAEQQGKRALAIRYYGVAAKRFTEQYLRDNPELAGRENKVQAGL